MSDMSPVIVPKADQISADDLLAGPITITISNVSIRPGTEQPVTINYEGDNGRPWKPCKSMSRVLVAAWGADATAYVGKSVTLFRDPDVKWGGLAVGGIRISHMSHMKSSLVLALTATKGSKKAFKVEPLKDRPVKDEASPDAWLDALEKRLVSAVTKEDVDAIIAEKPVQAAIGKARNGHKARLDAMIKTAQDRTTPITEGFFAEGERMET